MARTYLEDLTAGQRIPIGSWDARADDAIEFARRWEPQPHHIDAAAAEASPFGGLTLCSLYLFGIVTRLFFDYERPFAVQAMLGKTDVKLPRPARPGQRLHYSTEVESVRPSNSRPDVGVVVLADRLADPDDEAVLTQRVSLLLGRKPR